MKRVIMFIIFGIGMIHSAYAGQLEGMKGNPVDLITPEARRAILANEMAWEPRLPVKHPYIGLSKSDEHRADEAFTLRFNDGTHVSDVLRSLADLRGYTVEYGRGVAPARTLDGFEFLGVTWQQALQATADHLLVDITDYPDRRVLLIEVPDHYATWEGNDGAR